MQTRVPPIHRNFDHLFEYESFLTILRYYIDLNCFVIQPDPGDGSGGWMALHYHQRPTSLFDWQKKYGYVFDWSKLTDPAFEKSHAPGQPILLDAVGFRDIMMPIRRKKKRLGTIFSGAFAEKEPTYVHLQHSWRRLTGKDASPENAEFRRFVREMLETPVLEGPTLLAYREALEIFARVLAHNEYRGASQRLQQLMTGVFSKQFPHSYWMDWALGLPTRQATPLWNLNIEKTEWVIRDIGIRRIPTTVITVTPLNLQGRKRDVIEEMLRVYRFQRRSFRFGQTLSQTVGGKLENYGAVFVTSADPTLSRPQRRAQVQEIARRIERFAMEELGGPALVGIGETVTPGETLNESYRQAVLALHLGRELGKNMVGYGSVGEKKPEGVLGTRRFLNVLEHRVATESFSGIETIANEYLGQVLTLSLGNPEEIRLHLQYGLSPLMEAVKRRSELGEKEVTRFHENLILSLEKAGTTQEMVLAFKDALEKIIQWMQGRGALQAAYSIEKVGDYTADHFREPLRMSHLAGLAGVSISTLSRRFKKANGVGLEIHLRNLRLEEARRLLKAGSLPVAQVAKACGFKAGSHFARVFREKTGFSPQQFREKSQRL